MGNIIIIHFFNIMKIHIFSGPRTAVYTQPLHTQSSTRSHTMRANLISFLVSVTAILALSLLQTSAGYWVGPVWGYDGENMGDDYFAEEVKRIPADIDVPPFMGELKGSVYDLKMLNLEYFICYRVEWC